MKTVYLITNITNSKKNYSHGHNINIDCLFSVNGTLILDRIHFWSWMSGIESMVDVWSLVNPNKLVF